VEADNFWTWRNAMYRAANSLSLEDLSRVARMAYLEMALSGITTVGEFHYIHRDLDGNAYEDPNCIARLMVRAAREVGIRICLLRVAYARAGFDKPPNPLQKRFIEASPEEYLRNAEALRDSLDGRRAWVGAAPHSVRAVPAEYLREVAGWAAREKVPLHMHVSEQPAELAECEAEYGTTPVAFLAREGVLGPRFTAVHGIHITGDEIGALAETGSTVCACPTTERNLGDGIVPADALLSAGVRVALGSDSQAQIDLLEDARELEYHLRLGKLERGLIAPQVLFDCATQSGAASLGVPADAEDYFTVDLKDASIAGASGENLMSAVVFGLAKSAVRDVVVDGEFIVRDGRHPLQDEIVEAFLRVGR
jgi:formimidoylglutamate deiminase